MHTASLNLTWLLSSVIMPSKSKTQPFHYMAWHASTNNTCRVNWFSVIWRSIFCCCSTHLICNGSVWLVMVPFTVIEPYLNLQNWRDTKTGKQILNYTSFLPHTQGFKHGLACQFVYRLMGANCCGVMGLVFAGPGWHSAWKRLPGTQGPH